ncbi:MAG: hypothetical protein AAF408_05570 [Pseudomonadota bacterium]
MTNWLLWIGGGIATLVVAAALAEAYLKRNRKQRLSDMRPDPDKISKVSGIERYGLEPLKLAQLEHARLEREGWQSTIAETEDSATDVRNKEPQND